MRIDRQISYDMGGVLGLFLKKQTKNRNAQRQASRHRAYPATAETLEGIGERGNEPNRVSLE